MWKTIPSIPTNDVGDSKRDRMYLLKFLENINGVYVIYYGDDIVYIGSSKNLRRRLHTHLTILGTLKILIKEMYGDDNLTIKVREDKFKFERLTLEAKLVNKLHPPLNSQLF